MAHESPLSLSPKGVSTPGPDEDSELGRDDQDTQRKGSASSVHTSNLKDRVRSGEPAKGLSSAPSQKGEGDVMSTINSTKPSRLSDSISRKTPQALTSSQPNSQATDRVVADAPTEDENLLARLSSTW